MTARIDGASGSGRTTLATALTAALQQEPPGTVVTAPEEIDSVLRQVFPGEKVRTVRRRRLPSRTAAHAAWLATDTEAEADADTEADTEAVDTTGFASRQIADRVRKPLTADGPQGGRR
ncbi:hypothetical protein ACFV6F_04450 [Kitasatospora phosalacinea]|uniref:hypothetical protein n=1 Tax=Kitasatospora phosalacinea TaxID=2065 RepID=UPI003649620F